MEDGLEKQILLMEKGQFSVKAFGDALKAAAQEAIARMLAQTAISFIQAQITGAAWKQPALYASIASFGAADAVGLAAFESAQAAGTLRERGGPMFGTGLVGERGPERITPLVPSVITPSHNTTNNYGGASVTINVHGSDQSTILRTLRNAGIDRTRTSR